MAAADCGGSAGNAWMKRDTGAGRRNVKNRSTPTSTTISDAHTDGTTDGAVDLRLPRRDSGVASAARDEASSADEDEACGDRGDVDADEATAGVRGVTATRVVRGATGEMLALTLDSMLAAGGACACTAVATVVVSSLSSRIRRRCSGTGSEGGRT